MLSVVILTKNEEKNIVDALESVSFAGEVIVIDDFSDDHTKEVIEARRDPRIKIYKRRLDDFASQRNYALKKATGDWVLFLDADERVTPGLRGEIERLIQEKSDKNGYYLKRTDIIWGKKLHHGETAHVRLLRLAKKGKGEWKGKVHEQWHVKGKTGELTYPLYHYPHTTVTEFLANINLYTTIRARELFEEKEAVSTFQIITMPVGKFIQNYFLRQGFKDGVAGFVIAMLMSFHSFLVRSKLWLMWQKEK